MSKKREHWGDRPDGVLLRDLDSLHFITGIIYPNRCDNEAYISERIDLTNINAFLEKKNAANPEYHYKLFQLIVTALVKAITLRPKMNRFISGNRMYQRKYLSVAFVVKKKFSDRSEEGLAFRKFDGQSTIDQLHDSLCQEIHTQRKEGNVDNSTYFMDKLLKLPRWVLRFVMKILFSLDKKGKVPYDLIKDDPNYSSIFLTNLGSIDLSCGYHHLSNWGTCSCFVVIGKRHLAPECHEDGSVTVRPVLNIGITLDERIADGYYYSKTMKLVKYLLQNPELLELPAESEVDYLPKHDRRFVLDRKEAVSA